MELTNLIREKLPEEIENKIKLYLSHPCTDIIKQQFIYIDDIINEILNEQGYYYLELDKRLDYAEFYFKERNVLCDRCDCKLIDTSNRYTIEGYFNVIYGKDCKKRNSTRTKNGI
jgi:hypothetical protein